MERKIFSLAWIHFLYFQMCVCFLRGMGAYFPCVMMRYVCFSLQGGSLDKLFGVPGICKLIHTKKSASSVSWSCFLMHFALATTFTKTWNYCMQVNYELYSKNIPNHKCIGMGGTSAFLCFKATKLPLTSWPDQSSLIFQKITIVENKRLVPCFSMTDYTVLILYISKYLSIYLEYIYYIIHTHTQ